MKRSIVEVDCCCFTTPSKWAPSACLYSLYSMRFWILRSLFKASKKKWQEDIIKLYLKALKNASRYWIILNMPLQSAARGVHWNKRFYQWHIRSKVMIWSSSFFLLSLQWLRALPTSRQSFSIVFGECPYCSKVCLHLAAWLTAAFSCTLNRYSVYLISQLYTSRSLLFSERPLSAVVTMCCIHTLSLKLLLVWQRSKYVTLDAFEYSTSSI